MIFHYFTLLFVALKLMGYINWHWFWVVFPSIFGVMFVVVVFLGLAFMATYQDHKRGLR